MGPPVTSLCVCRDSNSTRRSSKRGVRERRGKERWSSASGAGEHMETQVKQYDLVIIGTGSAASMAAFRCRAAGWSVAVIDSRPFGGTCALRGCNPKKMLVSAAEALDAATRMAGKGVRADQITIDWTDRMRFKR